MASTYPLEIVQADRWAKDNKNLKGDQLKAEVDKQAWDDSVKSLVATPDVSRMMSTEARLDVKLGDAVLAQQPDVMDAIQRLRTKADANKKLTSTKEQTVTKSRSGARKSSLLSRHSPNRSRAVLRSRRCLRRLALSGLSALLLGRLDTSPRDHRRAELRLGPAMHSDAGRPAEIIGAAAAIGATTTSTSTGPG